MGERTGLFGWIRPLSAVWRWVVRGSGSVIYVVGEGFKFGGMIISKQTTPRTAEDNGDFFLCAPSLAVVEVGFKTFSHVNPKYCFRKLSPLTKPVEAINYCRQYTTNFSSVFQWKWATWSSRRSNSSNQKLGSLHRYDCKV